jgi:putative flippase GtrA
MLAELWRFVKAQVSTGLATFLDWGTLTLLIFFGVYYQLAIAAGAFLGACTDFSMKRYWAFRSGGKTPVASEAVKYAWVSAASLGLNCALAYLFVDVLRLPKVPGAIGASVIIGVVWNYPLHRLYVFGRETSKA